MRSVKHTLKGLLAGSVLLLPGHALANADSFYNQAVSYEEQGMYFQAVDSYKQFLGAAKRTHNQYNRVKYKLPVLNESKNKAASADIELYLRALDYRADTDSDMAVDTLNELITSYPNSFLLDDSMYLRGYIYAMDLFEFDEAKASLAQLRSTLPNSAYVDASTYIDAIILEQLGQTAEAKAMFEELRDKHASFSVKAFGFSMPRNTYQSRMWFDRAADRIAAIDEQNLQATKVVSQSREHAGGFERRVTLQVAGKQITVLLNPAVMVKGTDFLDENDNDLAEADSIQVFEGMVEGVRDSWVRAVFNGSSVQGMISERGRRYDLKTDTVTGTMVNYNPSLQQVGQSGHSSSLTAPGADNSAMFGNVGAVTGVTKVAPISTVLDSQFNAYNSGRGLFEALTVLAISDGIYREELGLALRIDKLVSIKTKGTDPLNVGSVPMDTMLSNFRDYRRNSKSLKYTKAAYVYLFSGNHSSDNQVGLAYKNVVCRTDGYDVSVSTPYQRDFLLAAHEMAHNLGAEHDVDTACSGDNSKIMAPYFTNSTTHKFSQCSKSSISMSLAKSCFEDAIDLQAMVTNISDENVGAAIRNNDLLRPAPAALEVNVGEATVTSIPQGCKKKTGGLVQCNAGILAAGEVRLYELETEHNSLDTRTTTVRSATGNKTEDVVLDNNKELVSFESGQEFEWELVPYDGPGYLGGYEGLEEEAAQDTGEARSAADRYLHC